MARTVDVSAFADALALELVDYGEDVKKRLHEDLQVSGQETLDAVQDRSPVDCGRYQMGWRCEFKGAYGDEKIVVHNATDWQLTHLLEKGHATRNGAGWVRAQPHIAPAFETGKRAFERRLNL